MFLTAETAEPHIEPRQESLIELFCENSFQSFTIFAKKPHKPLSVNPTKQSKTILRPTADELFEYV